MKKSIIIVLLVGVVLSALVTHYFTRKSLTESANLIAGDSKEMKPVYWVAPMDSNYRRNEPGKSPMGMDLIPVYEDDGLSSPGTVFISPNVVNNLGVRTGLVERRSIQSEVNTVGYVQYDEDQLVHIHPRVEGWIEKLYVKTSGSPVQRGEPLYSLYSPQLVSAQEELLLALNQSQTRFIRASEEKLKALHISVEQIRQLKSTRKVKQTITFYAPKSGVVDKLNVREGFFVMPGNTLMSIGTLENVWVEAEVYERQALLVSAGQAVTMTLDYLPGRNWQGEVDYVYPALDPKTRTLRVRLRFENTDYLLKPNMYAQVSIRGDTVEDVLVIPRQSVIRTGKQNRVVIARGQGEFKSVEVGLGQLNHQYAEIRRGLKEGDRIVTSAQFLLDSESSKTSDFKRMFHESDQVDDGSIQHNEPDALAKENDGDIHHSTIDHSTMDHSKMRGDSASVRGIEGSRHQHD